MEHHINTSNSPACMGGDKVMTATAPIWPIAGEREEKWMSEIIRDHFEKEEVSA